MSPHDVLTHEDDLFGRVALFNNFVTLEQIIDCAREISAGLVAGRPRRLLANLLIERESLTPAQAGSIEAALRQRVAEKKKSAPPDLPKAPTVKPKPMRKRAKPGESQMVVTVQPKATPPAEPADAADAEAQLRKAVARVAPARIFPELLDYVLQHNVRVINPKELAKATGEKGRAVATALAHWQKTGVVRKAGTGAYFFGPDEKAKEAIDIFLAAWRNPRQHATVLGYILATEK